MMSVPARMKVKASGVEAEVLALPETLPGVPVGQARRGAVLLFPDGEVKYYLMTAVEATEWKPA